MKKDFGLQTVLLVTEENSVRVISLMGEHCK